MLTDADPTIRLTNFEDSFVERKTSGDTGDWISATVALANSTPLDYPSVLFIGVRNDGTIEPNQNLENLQKSYSKRVSENIYPLPAYFPKVFPPGGISCLAIIIPGSPNRPHFAGLPFIRVGTETCKASQADVERLVADRNPNAYEIRKYLGQIVFVDIIHPPQAQFTQGRVHNSTQRRVIDCNQFWVTLEHSNNYVSISLNRIELSFEHVQQKLKLEILPS